MQGLAAADELVQCRNITADAANVADLAVALRIRYSNVDTALVVRCSDEHDARFLHGPTPY
ncbi:hypothetical protein AT984_12945 [Paucibacter sp. KCTC 42545]|nr:hypothetical protein AT984_12945 [Paucibacter sp. KCTC 42545]